MTESTNPSRAVGLAVPGVALLGLSIVAVALAMGSGRLGESGSSSQAPSISPEPSAAITPQSSPELTIWPEYYWYAEEFGVSIEETVRRMQIMEEFDSIPLREAVANRWAGGWLEHEPEFRFVFRVTGEDVGEFEAMTTDWPLPVDFITGATFTESEALAAMERIDDVLHAKFPNMGFGWEPRAGAIVMNGPEAPSAEFLRELEALAGVPVHYEYSPAVELQGG